MNIRNLNMYLIISIILLVLVLASYANPEINLPNDWNSLNNQERAQVIQNNPNLINSIQSNAEFRQIWPLISPPSQQHNILSNDPSILGRLSPTQQLDVIKTPGVGSNPNMNLVVKEYIDIHGPSIVFNNPDPNLQKELNQWCQNDQNFNTLSPEDQIAFVNSRLEEEMNQTFQYSGEIEFSLTFEIGGNGNFFININGINIDLSSINSNSGISSIELGEVPVLNSENGFEPGQGFIIRDLNNNPIYLTTTPETGTITFVEPKEGESFRINTGGRDIGVFTETDALISLNGNIADVISTDGNARINMGPYTIQFTPIEIDWSQTLPSSSDTSSPTGTFQFYSLDPTASVTPSTGSLLDSQAYYNPSMVNRNRPQETATGTYIPSVNDPTPFEYTVVQPPVPVDGSITPAPSSPSVGDSSPSPSAPSSPSVGDSSPSPSAPSSPSVGDSSPSPSAPSSPSVGDSSPTPPAPSSPSVGDSSPSPSAPSSPSVGDSSPSPSVPSSSSVGDSSPTPPAPSSPSVGDSSPSPSTPSSPSVGDSSPSPSTPSSPSVGDSSPSPSVSGSGTTPTYSGSDTPSLNTGTTSPTYTQIPTGITPTGTPTQPSTVEITPPSIPDPSLVNSGTIDINGNFHGTGDIVVQTVNPDSNTIFRADNSGYTDNYIFIANEGEVIIFDQNANLIIQGQNDIVSREFAGSLYSIQETYDNGDSSITIQMGGRYEDGILVGSSRFVTTYDDPDIYDTVLTNQEILPEYTLASGILADYGTGFPSANINLDVRDGVTYLTSINSYGSASYCWYEYASSANSYDCHCVKNGEFEILFTTENYYQSFSPITFAAIADLTGNVVLNQLPLLREVVKEVILKSPDAMYINMGKEYQITSSKYGSNYGTFENKRICFRDCNPDPYDRINVYVRDEAEQIVSTGVMGSMVIEYANNIRDVFDPHYVLLLHEEDEYTSILNNMLGNSITSNDENDLLFRLNQEADPGNPPNEELEFHQLMYYQNALPASFSEMYEKVRFYDLVENSDGYLNLNLFTYMVNNKRKLVLNRYSYNNIIELNFRHDKEIEIPVDTFVVVDNNKITYNLERDLSISPKLYDVPIYFRSPNEVRAAFGNFVSATN
jgi:hypothetical protein